MNFINELNQKAADNGRVIFHGKANENGDVISDISQIKRRLAVHKEKYINHPYNLISSQRSFKHICRRIDAIWQENKLMGEIDLECLCLLVVLREELPAVFEVLRKNKNTLIEKIKSYIEAKKKQDKTAPEKNKEAILLEELSSFFPFAKANYAVNLEEIISYLDYLFKCGYGSINLGQSVALNQNTNEFNDYLKRFSLEQVPSDELADQEVIRLFNNIDKEGAVESLIKNLQNEEKSHHWIEAYTRFYRGYFKPTDKNIYEFIYIKMVDFYYKDVVRNNRSPNTLINHADIQQFMILLLEKCLTSENVEKLFELTLNIPTILMANTHNVGPSSCLELFLSKEQDEELYNIFINKLSVNNEITKQLSITYLTTKQSLEWIATRIISIDKEESKKVVLWKGVIFALIEVNNKTDENYQFGLWFVCYIINSHLILNKQVFTSNEIECIKSSLNKLSIDNVGEYYLHLSDPKGRIKKVLSALEEYA